MSLRENKPCPDCNSPMIFIHSSRKTYAYIIYKCYNENCKSEWLRRVKNPRPKIEKPVKEYDSRPLNQVIKS